jgi:hypothetical protein
MANAPRDLVLSPEDSRDLGTVGMAVGAGPQAVKAIKIMR